MKLEDLKSSIEANKYDYNFLIFIDKDSEFLSEQYIYAIKDILHKDLNYIEDINQVLKSSSLFGGYESDYLDIVKVDTFDTIDKRLFNKNNLIIVCKKISDEAKAFYNEYIVNFSKLENWQIKDYLYSMCDGLDDKQLEYILNITNNNIYRLQVEIDRITLFDKSVRSNIFKEFMGEGVLEDLSSYTIFNLTNAILKRDKSAVSNIYKELKSMDVEPIGLLTILYNNFRNIIKIQLTNNATPEGTNIPSKQFWAIKHNCGIYTKQKLITIFIMLTDLDRKIKTGELNVSFLIDYILVNIFCE